MSRKKKKQQHSAESASDAQAQVASLPRTAATSEGRPSPGTASDSYSRVHRDVASSSPELSTERDSWDAEQDYREVFRTTIGQALLGENTARMSEDISSRFEQCRDKMRDVIAKSRWTYMRIGVGVLVAVVIGVLTIVVMLINPRLEKLETKSDTLSSSLVRIETILETTPSSQGSPSDTTSTETPTNASEQSDALP